MFSAMFRAMFRAMLLLVCLAALLHTGRGLLTEHSGHTYLPQYALYGRSLVLIGGGSLDGHPEFFEKIVEHAGGKGVAKIGVVTASSGAPESSFNYYRDVLLSHGSKEVNWLPFSETHRNLSSDPDVVSLVRNQTGFMFSGGDQTRVVNSLFLPGRAPSPALVAMREQFGRGAVIAGTSAGTACQTANVMVAGGLSWDALRYGAYDTPSGHHPDDLVYDAEGGLGFLHGFVLDSHFSERGREGRLLRLLSDTQHRHLGTAVGLGLDEETGLVITHAGTAGAVATVTGAHGVVVIDVSKSVLDKTARYFTVSDVNFSYLTEGDQLGLSDLSVTFSTNKTALKGHEYYNHALSSKDIFDGNRRDHTKKGEFIRVATSVFDAKYDVTSHGVTHEKKPQFRVDVSRSCSESAGYIDRGHSFQEDVISYKNLHVNVREN